jgi:hypothetical protein
VNQGNVDNRNITNNGGVVAGNLYGTSKDANKLVGTIVSGLYKYGEQLMFLTAYRLTMV